ncbi:MAG: urease accessory protein UreF [Sandaracinaceae bacterium]|nr:urease accessory protein UreF [Sandaracinaceae bacterium]
MLQLSSASLPVGGFTYSRGLEAAVELGWVTDAGSARAWIGGLLHECAGRLDAPLVLRAHDAFSRGDVAAVARWAAFDQACRETDELRRESSAMGRALGRWLVELGLAAPSELAGEVRESYVVTFGLAAHRLGLDADAAVSAYLWSWLESGVTAAVKLVPLGQTDGQRITLALGAELEEVAGVARALADDDLGALVPGFAIASAQHETLHTRLFRS